jgi:hypothetical protein
MEISRIGITIARSPVTYYMTYRRQTLDDSMQWQDGLSRADRTVSNIWITGNNTLGRIWKEDPETPFEALHRQSFSHRQCPSEVPKLWSVTCSVTLCSLTGSYKGFGGSSYLFLQDKKIFIPT